MPKGWPLLPEAAEAIATVAPKGRLSSAPAIEKAQSRGDLCWAAWLMLRVGIQQQRLLPSLPPYRPNPPPSLRPVLPPPHFPCRCKCEHVAAAE